MIIYLITNKIVINSACSLCNTQERGATACM